MDLVSGSGGIPDEILEQPTVMYEGIFYPEDECGQEEDWEPSGDGDDED